MLQGSHVIVATMDLDSLDLICVGLITKNNIFRINLNLIYLLIKFKTLT